MLIYDCSNSPERPPHRGGGGPITNDIMRYLKENSDKYNASFVDSPTDADVIITNDVFPKNIVSLRKPLVKRMCGPFWNVYDLDRNEPLNNAARRADKVIFITEYSRDNYFHFYGNDLKDHTVIKHWVDTNIFNITNNKKPKKYTFVASATSWNRKEKRLSEIIKFAEMYPKFKIILIGTCSDVLPNNMSKVGYVSNPQNLAKIFNDAHAFLNLSYRDAATKTIPQAISCGLPVLYADSGGVSEMVGCYGVGIEDNKTLDIQYLIPPLNRSAIRKATDNFLDRYRHVDYNLISAAIEKFSKNSFNLMLDGYYNNICEALNA